MLGCIAAEKHLDSARRSIRRDRALFVCTKRTAINAYVALRQRAVGFSDTRSGNDGKPRSNSQTTRRSLISGAFSKSGQKDEMG